MIGNKRKLERAVNLIIVLFLGFFLISMNEIDNLENSPISGGIDVQFLKKGSAARSGVKLDDVQDIVIHYVGNPGSTAQQNRDYFNNPDSRVSSHFIIGMDGKIIQAIPLDERSAATNWRNNDTISIELCHPDETGKLTQETYDSLIWLSSWLIDKFDLEVDNIIRHYDVTGKHCPLYFVEHEDKWVQFKEDVRNYDKKRKPLFYEFG